MDSGLVDEHANNERRIAQGGYGDRQIFELVQNGADELRDQPGGEIAVVLTSTHLYCANEGSPVTPEGADAILRMSVSRKRGGQIGRFGVGVKSVLAICDAPQFFSKDTTGRFGFGFDRKWSSDMIRQVCPDTVETPVLRMAKNLDVQQCVAEDPVLDELLRWATTVVRLPLNESSVPRLAADLKSFPVEFPLFSPHVGAVTLDDRRTGRSQVRRIDQRVDSDRRFLEEELPDGTTRNHIWRVFTRVHRPSAEALRAAGELHDRPEIDISWAVPESSGSRGTFWAYFPTKFATTLRGILNAPWKTSEDRQAIFDGNAFNDELISVAARLVVESLPELVSEDDPARYLDYLPGRGREAPQFADDRLTQAIWKTAVEVPSVVGQDGVLRRPTDVHLHPDDLDPNLLKLWSEYRGRPMDWAHNTVERRERRARVNMMFSLAGRYNADIREWLEAVVSDGSAAASAIAIRIAAELVQSGQLGESEAAEMMIVRAESGKMVPPIRGKVFRRCDHDDLQDDLIYVDDAVRSGFRVEDALDALGIREADAAGRFAAVVDQGFSGYTDEKWTSFWELARTAGHEAVLESLSGCPPLRVRTVSGVFRAMRDCLLPGPVVPEDGSRDATIAVDLEFHAADQKTLVELGMLDSPAPDCNPRLEPWFPQYQEAAWLSHVETLDAGAPRPQVSTMRVEGRDPAGPLGLLMDLSPEGRAAFLENLPDDGLVGKWSVQVGRQRRTRRAIDSPLCWMAKRYGNFRTSQGVADLADCVGPQLDRYSALLPVADIPVGLAAVFDLPAALDKVPDRIWTSLIDRAAASKEDVYPAQVYSLLLESRVDLVWPSTTGTRCRIGDEWSTVIARTDIAVTADPAEYDLLIRENVPALLAPDDESAALLISSWKMRRASDVVVREVRHVAEGEPVPVLDIFPHLRIVRRDIGTYSLVRCSELEEITRSPHGMSARALQWVIDANRILVRHSDDDMDMLLALDVTLALGLGSAGRRSILERREQQREGQRIKQIRQADTVEAKILALIGEDNLRAGLPRGLEDDEAADAGGPLIGEQLARLAINTYGDGLLRHYRQDVKERNEAAPETFAGSMAGRRFVTDLGLPESFAGTAAVTPPEMEEVAGPTEFPVLHDYQERVTARMVELLGCPQPDRALLRLPTGAGKTRVAVEAVVRVASTRRLDGPILWIAESEELCEQAVESWRFVWQHVGPPERLTINRFWGSNDAAPVRANLQLIVATDAKLASRLPLEAYAWLRDPAVVIVDEAHRATTPRYTRIFEHLGLTHRNTARPLVGLTATPYRGNEESTRRLVGRFGANRLDEGLFLNDDPYPELQDLGVLSRVEHRELTGVTLRLTDSERQATEERRWLPSSAEETLAQNQDRNRMLLDEISALPEDWPVLVFATSVNHAHRLTARLNGRGVPSRAIDGYTPMPERRNIIDRYRNREIRVLTNYGVVAQGFDAPATRAVVIARPTYSPGLYQQMIGRGLRGPLNGGKDVCLILDVRDNIENFGRSLAFTGFEHLWKR